MKVTLASSAGFCFGVKRAIEIAESEGQGTKVFGELVHNPQVVESMNRQGIQIQDRDINNIQNLENNNVVITAHGIPESTKIALHKTASKVIDATCPLVYVVHKFAKDLEEEGYQVVEIGDPNHIEVIGATKDLKNPIIINSEEEVDNIQGDKIGIVVQTTKNPHKVDKIIKKIKSKFKDVKYHDTICHPTKQRQEAAVELAKTTDIMIVVGGYNSSNTQELNNLCNKHTESHQIENPEELQEDWFQNKTHCGVTAGASTPDDVIGMVVKRIQNAF